jgi:hypothetical protein
VDLLMTLFPTATCPACKADLPPSDLGLVRCGCGWLCRIDDKGNAESAYLFGKRRPKPRGPQRDELAAVLDADDERSTPP